MGLGRNQSCARGRLGGSLGLGGRFGGRHGGSLRGGLGGNLSDGLGGSLRDVGSVAGSSTSLGRCTGIDGTASVLAVGLGEVILRLSEDRCELRSKALGDDLSILGNLGDHGLDESRRAFVDVAEFDADRVASVGLLNIGAFVLERGKQGLALFGETLNGVGQAKGLLESEIRRAVDSGLSIPDGGDKGVSLVLDVLDIAAETLGGGVEAINAVADTDQDTRYDLDVGISAGGGDGSDSGRVLHPDF